MKLMKSIFLGLFLVVAFPLAPAVAAISVFACEPEWGALATALGGNDVDV